MIYLQGVHYAIWLAWIPQTCASHEALPTMRMSARGWRRDVGISCLLVVAGAMVTVLVAAGFSPTLTANADLFLAGAHGYLELVATAYVGARGAIGP